MKKLITAASLVALFAATPALAADLGGSTKDDVDYSANGPAFVGFGVGIHAGGQFSNVEIADGEFSFDGIGADGLVGGLHVEYLFPVGRFRVGPYLEGGFSNVNTNIELGSDVDLLNQENYYGGGIKAGVVVSETLIYGRFGLERSNWDVVENFSAEVDSLVIGGGIETMIAAHTSLGVEGTYHDVFNVEAEGLDVSDYLDESEGLRGVVRLTYRH